jgi:hypothetical protein
LRDWCWLGTATDEAELQAMLEAPPRASFDLDIYRVLVKHLPRTAILPLGVREPADLQETPA